MSDRATTDAPQAVRAFRLCSEDSVHNAFVSLRSAKNHKPMNTIKFNRLTNHLSHLYCPMRVQSSYPQRLARLFLHLRSQGVMITEHVKLVVKQTLLLNGRGRLEVYIFRIIQS